MGGVFLGPDGRCQTPGGDPGSAARARPVDAQPGAPASPPCRRPASEKPSPALNTAGGSPPSRRRPRRGRSRPPSAPPRRTGCSAARARSPVRRQPPASRSASPPSPRPRRSPPPPRPAAPAPASGGRQSASATAWTSSQSRSVGQPAQPVHRPPAQHSAGHPARPKTSQSMRADADPKAASARRQVGQVDHRRHHPGSIAAHRSPAAAGPRRRLARRAAQRHVRPARARQPP